MQQTEIYKLPTFLDRVNTKSFLADISIECNKYKMDLATDGTIVSDALKGIQSKIDRISENGNGSGNRNGDGDKTTVNNNQTGIDTDTEESVDKDQDQTSNTVF